MAGGLVQDPRQAADKQAPTVTFPKRLPLIVQPENRDESTLKDAKLLNGYVEKSDATGEYWVYKRPGLLQTATTIAGNGYGVYNWLGDIYRIQGATMYKNDVGLSGTLDTTGGVYRFSSCLGATPKLQFGNGVKSYNYDSGGGIVQMSGVNFPGNSYATGTVKGFAYLDGTTYVMDANAGIHGCDSLNDPAAWTDLTNLISAQIEPDKGVGLMKQLVYVIAFKQWTTEVFYDEKNATASPLGPVQGAKVNYGCVNIDTVQELDGTLLWVGTNRSSSAQVIMLNNLKPEVISTKPIERLLGEMTFTNMLSFGIKYEGHRFYGFTSITDNLTLVYDMTDKYWAQWTDSSGNYFPIISSTFNSSTGRILQHATNGKLYLMDAAYHNDDGDTITWDLYTPNFDGGVRRRKQMTMLEFIGDQTAGSVLQVRTNDHDYDSTKWTNFRRVDMSVKKPVLTNCGTFTRRVHHLRHQSNTALRLQAIELQVDLGTL
jgi:hypothetical protein